MKTFEDYKAKLLSEPSEHLREQLLGEAEESGFTAWQMAELAGACRELWA